MSAKDTKMSLNRREVLLQGLFGAGFIGLRSLATGLPISFLLNPRSAKGAPPAAAKPQYLIFSTSVNGDPVNANVPGTYNVPGTTQPLHPPTFATPSSAMIGSTSYAMAAPWATLASPASTGGAPVLNNTVFFHHGTYTVVHPNEHEVLALMGGTSNEDMMVSLFASQLGPALQTVQYQPISLGSNGASETITYQGRPQPNLTPLALASTLTNPSPTSVLGPLANLQHIRDHDLDALNALARSEGNTYQQAFIDQYANSQTQVRELSQSLMANLASIKDNTPASQVTAAIILIQMNVAPVISIHIPFGGDNHTDLELATETAQTTSGVATIFQLQQALAGAGLQDKVSFAMLNVFGRNLLPPQGINGRNHLGNHHCSVLIGSQFQGSVIGGIEPASGDFRAQSVDSTTGLGVANGGGDVVFTDTLGSMALTLGQGLGVSPSYLTGNIFGTSGTTGGAKVIPAALVP
jgi:hypothetical protein